MPRRQPRNLDSAPESNTPESVEDTVTDTATPDLTDETQSAQALTPDTADLERTEPAAESESTEPQGETPAAVDYTAFNEAVARAVEVRDTASGEVPETAGEGDDAFNPHELVKAAFAALPDTKARNAAKKTLEASMKDAMSRTEWQEGRAYMHLGEILAATKATGKSADKPPTDPKAAFTERYQSLLLALALVGTEAPEGVDVDSLSIPEGALESAQALIAHAANEAEDKGDAPESTPVVRAAVKLASGKATPNRKAGVGTGAGGGLRRDVGKHIASAFADVEPGTFLTVAQIVKHKSEEYGEDTPSAGAVSARLFPASGKTTLDFVTPGTGADGKVRGATKN